MAYGFYNQGPDVSRTLVANLPMGSGIHHKSILCVNKPIFITRPDTADAAGRSANLDGHVLVPPLNVQFPDNLHLAIRRS